MVGGMTLVSGCNREEAIATYSAPKEPEKPVQTAAAQEGSDLPTGHPSIGQSGNAGGQTASVRPQGSGPQWTVPAAWKQIPASGMRYAAFTITEDTPPVTLTVIPLPASPVAANVNRWEGELGLPPTKAEEVDKVVTHIDSAGGAHVDMVDLIGPESTDKPRQRMLAAMVENQGKMWFFKAVGPSENVGAQRENFEAFLKSVKFGEAPAVAQQQQQQAPANPPQQQPQQQVQAGAKTSGLTAWTKPQDWRRDETPRSMRELTFFAGPDGSTAEVIVSRMGGNFGGLLANINRWRQQVGLPPVNSEKDQPATMMQLGDGAAATFDMSGPGANNKPLRQIVAMTPRKDGVWFFKILGPTEVVDKQKAAFDEFLKSVKFAAGSVDR
jgi:hypothetical protein